MRITIGASVRLSLLLLAVSMIVPAEAFAKDRSDRRTTRECPEMQKTTMTMMRRTDVVRANAESVRKGMQRGQAGSFCQI